MDKVFNKLRSLDAYPKVNEDFYSRTISGGLITVATSAVVFLLFFSELRLYLHTVTETRLLVDTSRGGKLHINFDVTFPFTRCSLLSLDAMDISGEKHLDIRHDIFKKRIDSHGNVIETRQDGIGATKFSVTEHYKAAEYGNIQPVPGVFFFYDLSPIKVTYKEEHTPFLHFATNVCAIVGGVFTVAGIVDSFIYHGQKALKKRKMGKFS